MDWSVLLPKAFAALLLPPGVLALLLLVAVVSWRRHPVAARRVVMTVLLLTWCASLPVLSVRLARELQSWPALSPATLPSADAIVVCGARNRLDAPEYDGDVISSIAFSRVRYAAFLHRRTGLPVMLTGGRPFGEARAESEISRDFMVNELRVPVRWIETASRTTRENAAAAAARLLPGHPRILLVTHGWHMPRAVMAFQEVGFSVTPAPTELIDTTLLDETLLAWLPDADALWLTSLALREYLGRLWYRL